MMRRGSNNTKGIDKVSVHLQYDYCELLHRLRQFFIFEVCRDETVQENGEFRCETFSPRNKTEQYLIYDYKCPETIIGYVLITRNTIHIGNGWHISEMMILPKYRGKGYGMDAISHIIDIHKYERIEVCPSDNGSEAFWDKVAERFKGYKEDGFIIVNNV